MMQDTKTLLRVPIVAWPTVFLCAAAVLAWSGSLALGATGTLPWLITVPLSAVAAFVCFTPLHDATHRSVGKDPLINGIVGRLCSVPLVGPYPAFRHLHLSHHRHTNDPVHDPDQWAGRGPAWMLPRRWLTPDLHNYWRYLPDRNRPRAEWAESVLTMVAFQGLAVALLFTPVWELALFGWLIPGRLAIAFLSFSFDYLPHRPHQVQDDRFRATVNFTERWLTIPLLSQNYHLLHHLYPAVPFYRYSAAWRALQPKLEAKGARTVSVFDLHGTGLATRTSSPRQAAPR